MGRLLEVREVLVAKNKGVNFFNLDEVRAEHAQPTAPPPVFSLPTGHRSHVSKGWASGGKTVRSTGGFVVYSCTQMRRMESMDWSAYGSP